MPRPFKVIVRDGFYCYNLRGEPTYIPNLPSRVQITIQGMDAPLPSYQTLLNEVCVRSEDVYRMNIT
jgi:hypothetical protein